MRIAITGPDILLNKGGTKTHAINVLQLLVKYFEITYLPDLYLYKSYLKRKEEVAVSVSEIGKLGIRIPEYFLRFLGEKGGYKKIMDTYLKEKFDFIFSFEFINSSIVPTNFTYDLSKRMKVKFGICIHALGDFDMHTPYYIFSSVMMSGDFRLFLYRIYHYINRKLLLAILPKMRNLSFVAVVNAEYYKNVRINFRNVEILDPSNGIGNSGDRQVSVDEFGKENKVIFFSRLTYTKGLFDILKISRRIAEDSDLKVVVVGKFEWEHERKRFFKLVRGYGLLDRIQFKGYLDDDDLFKEIATSKVMVYPSHSDSFSRAVLQALSVGTPVVAYDIAGLGAYRNLKAVKLVKEFDYDKMASEALRIASLNSKDELFDNDFHSFMRRFNWENVALKYKELFDKYAISSLSN
ncbi:MAG: glycosyltransferase [Thermoplasmatales archaeon]